MAKRSPSFLDTARDRVTQMRAGSKVASAVGVVAGVVTIVTGMTGVWGGGGSASSKDPAAQVRSCMAQHGLSRAKETQHRETEGPYSTVAFASCLWPPPEWADEDGYSEIVVRGDAGPGTEEATGDTEADRFAAPCSEMEVAYSFGKQGAFQRRPPFSLLRGTIMFQGYVGPEVWKGDQRRLPFYPDRDEGVVIHSAAYRLDFVRCTAP